MARGNELGESLRATIAKSRIERGLFVNSMLSGQTIRADIDGNTLDGVVIEQSRSIAAMAIGNYMGALRITEDTAEEGNWMGREICVGSYSSEFVGIEYKPCDLLRGHIIANAGVVVDLSAEHFVGKTPPTKLMAQWQSLSLEGEPIF